MRFEMARFKKLLHKLLLIYFLWVLSNDVPVKIVENGCETFLVIDNQTTESIWCFFLIYSQDGVALIMAFDRVSCQVY